MNDATTPGPLLQDKIAIVTGGAAGIGFGICEAFAAHGALVTIVDIDEEKAMSAGARLGSRVSTLIGDVRLPETADRVVSDVLGRHGRIDVLVNNVGHYLHPPRPFES